MFEIRLSADAKAHIDAVAQREGFARPGLMVHRQGPVADVSRGADGHAKWEVQRRHPWRAQAGDFGAFESETDIELVDGVHVWLAAIPKPQERGIVVAVVDGALHVEPLDA